VEDFSGSVAIVTGATSGIGRETALELARAGAYVVVGGRDADRAEDVVGEIRALGCSAVAVLGDVAEPATNRRLVETAVSELGGLDLVVAAAGDLSLGKLDELSDEFWHRAMGANLNAVFYLLRDALPHLRETGEGKVVVIGSIAGLKVFPNHAAYCATKAALIQLVKQCAKDYGPEVRFNIVCPGQVDTPLLWDSAQAFDNPESVVQETADRLPLKRLGKPEDVAHAVLYLAGPQAAWVTGSCLVVDGGSMTIG
jgi:NAD(P)-dependent dehydrogenase (short-subunit alcohol dehydrogenase family)